MGSTVTQPQVPAFRVARHHLAERAPDANAAAAFGCQDTPPGSAGMALAARVDEPVGAAADLVLVPSVGRDDFHQALRKRLPDGLLWWCKGCGTHHVHPSLWRATGIRGVLAIVGREGRTAVFGAPPRGGKGPEDPGAELARRFLRGHGSATPKRFADWLGTTTGHAQTLWDRAGELTEVRLDGSRRWVLAVDADLLADPPEASGVRLIPNLDPLATARDREVLIPSPSSH